jgi:hypothetical protein
METPKLTKSVPSKHVMQMPLGWVYAFSAIGLLLAASIALLVRLQETKGERDDRTEEARRLKVLDDRLDADNAVLRHRLDEMTATAGAYRSYEVYNDCVQQSLGIYRMAEVKRAYERYFRSTELTGQCLAESSWYETHPVGINPAHMHR